jgi:hypothetical protein
MSSIASANFLANVASSSSKTTARKNAKKTKIVMRALNDEKVRLKSCRLFIETFTAAAKWK